MAVKKRLGEMLVEAGIIDNTQLHAALGHQRQWGGRLGAVLVELKLASEEAIVDALALKFGFEIARLDRIEPYAFEQARAFVPREYAGKNHVFPISADTGVLTVAMSDPTNLALTDELAFRSGRRVKVCIAGENAIDAALRIHFGDDGHGMREAIDLGADDGTAMEAVYDPIGATSSEQLSHFFEQPAAPGAKAPARPVAAPAAKPAARTTVSAAQRAQPAKPPPPPPQAPAKPPPGSSAAIAAELRARTRAPSVLQLEDQPTGSLPLDPGDPLDEEDMQTLDGVPLPDADAAAPGEPAPEPAFAEAPYAEPAYAEPAVYAEPPAYAEPGQPSYPEQPEYAEQPATDGAQATEPAPHRDLTEEEVEILAAIGRLAQGDDATPTVVRPAQLVAALLRLMLRKQWISEQELLDEILRG
jgi:type IV pilus assembly protein PilB